MKHGTFGTRSLEFTHSKLALVAAVVRRMFKTRVKLVNISRVLFNLLKRLVFIMFKDSSSLLMFIYGTFEDCIGHFYSHYCSFYFRISTR